VTAASVDEVLALFERVGDHTYDEVVTQTTHAEQTAARANADGAAPTLVAAALLHDVGHLLELEQGERGADLARDLRHDVTGPAWLADLFPPAVTDPIALHVRAKRYRCAIDPSYHELLSPGSRASLVRQGGPYDASDTSAFEAEPGWADAVRLRGWDDEGKVLGLEVAPLASYRALLDDLARSR
jgi:phosphonate degradation associated HDIG domain protein